MNGGRGGATRERLLPSTLRMVAWEVTRRCNLACVHCRASAVGGPYPDELSTEEGRRLLADIASFSDPVVILTGGEPLLREDILDLARFGHDLGLRMVLATNGTVVTAQRAEAMKAAGIQRVSVSIDGADAGSHDAFRRVPGAFAEALRGIEILKAAGLPIQINTTVTRANLPVLPDILRLSRSLGALAHHIFLLVPTGRGKDLSDQAIAAEDYERTLLWFHGESERSDLLLKATCAPHYFRIVRQHGGGGRKTGNAPPEPLHAATRGCLGGSAFCFISHTGQVQPCGYLEIDCGRVREQPFRKIWERSPVFGNLRDLGRYGGKCGRCPFLRVCGGCRARAQAAYGDYLAEEPLCVYQPDPAGIASGSPPPP